MRSFGEVPPTIERDAPKAISKKELAVIWTKAHRDFSNAASSLVVRKFLELAEKQDVSPLISPSNSEIERFLVTYCDSLRTIAGHLAASLAQPLGRRHSYGQKERKWIRKAAKKFNQERRSRQAGRALFAETFGKFTLQNNQDAENTLCQMLARAGLSSRLMVHVSAELEFAETQYREDQKLEKQVAASREPPPGEKLKDPVRYPKLTVAEAMELFGKSRSTIYRWLDERTLARASMGKSPGKRTSCLILTASAAKLFEESPE